MFKTKTTKPTFSKPQGKHFVYQSCTRFDGQKYQVYICECDLLQDAKLIAKLLNNTLKQACKKNVKENI